MAKKKKEVVYATPAEIGKVFEEVIKEETIKFREEMNDPENLKEVDKIYEKMKACKDINEALEIFNNIK